MNPRALLGLILAVLGAPCAASGQVARSKSPPEWSFTIDVGGFARGNADAVSGWLRRNAYGSTEPKHCGIGILANLVCSSPMKYPKASGSLVGGLITVRRAVTDRVGVEVAAATEQSGTVTGWCDDGAVPTDARCTDPFMVVAFSGGSFASLATYSTHHVRVGAGPALLLANWEMKPAHLAGLWFDATANLGSTPWLARAQYRVYRATTRSPDVGFSGFHPSTLFLGLGFAAITNNSP